MRHKSKDVEWAAGYMSLELRSDVWNEDINLGVVNIQLVTEVADTGIKEYNIFVYIKLYILHTFKNRIIHNYEYQITGNIQTFKRHNSQNTD